jgi:hypothetical protein
MSRPAISHPPSRSEGTTAGQPADGSSASRRDRRQVREGWKPTLVRDSTFARLVEVQRSTREPRIDLSYLTDACLAIALEVGPESIVKRALEDLARSRGVRSF